MIKSGVQLANLTPQMAFAHVEVKGVYARRGYLCVVTSAFDGKHGTNTLHQRDGICRALDYRTKGTVPDGEEESLRKEIKVELGDEFDVVLEAVGTENEHIHVEWDPK